METKQIKHLFTGVLIVLAVNCRGAVPPSAPKAEAVTQELQAGNFIYKVNGIEFRKQVGAKTADGIFILIDLTINNVSSKSINIFGDDFKVVDDSGNTYSYSMDGAASALVSPAEKSVFMGNKHFQPNIPTSTTLIFEVPDQTKTYKLEVSGGDKKTYEIPLMK